MKKSTKKIEYATTYNQLMEHISAIENESISLDELGAKVKTALQLIETCEQALRNIEKELPQA